MVIYATVGEDHYSAGKVLSADETSAVSRALLGPPVRRQQPARNHGYQYYQQVEGIQEQDRHCALEGNTSGHSMHLCAANRRHVLLFVANKLCCLA